jgi:hypothetical protein
MRRLLSGNPFAWRMTAFRALARAVFPMLGVSHPKCIPNGKTEALSRLRAWAADQCRSKNCDEPTT